MESESESITVLPVLCLLNGAQKLFSPCEEQNGCCIDTVGQICQGKRVGLHIYGSPHPTGVCFVHEGKATAANVGRVMQVELVVVDQGLEVPDEKAHAGSSELGPEALNPLIGDGCAVPMAGVVPMQENLYCCHGAVLRPTISPQDLRAFARDRQALCVIVPNDSWIVVGVPDPQPHHPPGITIHTSVYGKAIRL